MKSNNTFWIIFDRHIFTGVSRSLTYEGNSFREFIEKSVQDFLDSWSMIISIYYVISTDSTKNDGQRILIISYNAYGSSYFLIKDLTINFADNPGNESIVFAAPSQVEQIWYLKIFFSKCKRKIAYYLVNCGSHLVNHFTSDEDEEPFCFRLNINQNLPIVINVDFIESMTME